MRSIWPYQSCAIHWPLLTTSRLPMDTQKAHPVTAEPQTCLNSWLALHSPPKTSMSTSVESPSPTCHPTNPKLIACDSDRSDFLNRYPKDWRMESAFTHEIVVTNTKKTELPREAVSWEYREV
uniref:Ig-like domain-containing protein n=1 Tax=Panagrellus redivivus TaxID=6233 RepID=A0A7E4VG65_PANRE